MTDLNRAVVRSVVFDQDGAVVIEYCIPAKDVRQNRVVLNHILSIPYGDQYNDEIDTVCDAVLALITDVLEDFDDMEPIQLEPLEDADDDDDE